MPSHAQRSDANEAQPRADFAGAASGGRATAAFSSEERVEPQSQRSPTLASQRPALMRPTGMDRRSPDNGSKAGAADFDASDRHGGVGSGAPCSEGERSFGVLDSAWGPDERVVDELANLSVSSEESSGLSLGSAARATHTERSESDGLLHMLLSKIEALESELRGRAVPTPDIPAAEAKSGASAAGAGGHVICVDTNTPSVSEG